MPRKSTRNANGAGYIRQRKDGTWEGRYTAGRDPGTGKQIQRAVYGKSQADVRKRLNAVLADLDNKTYIEPSKLVLGQWLDTWLKEYTLNVKDQTRTQYEQVIRTHLKPNLGKVKLTALQPLQIQSLYRVCSATTPILGNRTNG